MSPPGRLTRRTRRRLFVILTAAVVGGSLPLWAPRLLASLPTFTIAHVEVVGTEYVAPNEVVQLADVGPEASIWDDPSAWERAVESHPLVREARVRRSGVHSIEIRVLEDRPVALAATPRLVPVNEEGRVLPLDPTAASLDLPILAGEWNEDHGALDDPAGCWLAALLAELAAHDPGFVAQVSEIGYGPGGSIDIRMLPAAPADRILLPAADPIRGLRRVASALGDAAPARVPLADARFAGQVVLRLGGERDR